MTGVDTNVLLRLIVRDDAEQAATADRFFAGLSVEQPGFVSALALCEAAWTLQRSYGYPRGDVVRVLQKLVTVNNLVVERVDSVVVATRSFEEGGAGFGDHFIAACHAEAGAFSTVTFDRKASRLPGWRLLS